MNVKQAKEISIEKVLQNLGLEPIKTNGDDLWFLSPLRQEKTPSFKVNRKLNKWFDHGEQIGGNVIDFVIQKFGFNVREALEYLKKFDDFSFSQEQFFFETTDEKDNIDHIEKIIPVQHIALIQYLKSRGIINYQEIRNLKEIHYFIKRKKYFALGFRNNSGGFEVRSKYAKICLGTKDISHVKSNNETLRIFEGFFDYLSFQQQKINEDSDYLILNSVALLNKNISILKDYKAIELYLDLDEAGNKYTEITLENFENAVDCRAIFKGYKDYSEWYSIMQLEVS
jgi:Toprim-like/CHC2 zinc finger